LNRTRRKSEKKSQQKTKSPKTPSAPRRRRHPAELIRFLIDRSGYIKALETEGSPESFSRIENLKELANAAHDAEARGETLAEFLDHAALASDTDQFDPTPASPHDPARRQGPGVSAGLPRRPGRGLFPHSRTLNNPTNSRKSAACATSA